MNDGTRDETGARRYPARSGIAALNLIAPGLGLLRVGDWRRGVLFLLAPFALLPVLTAGMGHFPVASYGRVIFALAVVLSLLVGLYVIPAVLTWRASRFRSPLHWWSRWYSRRQ